MDKKKQEARQKVWEHLHKDGITFNDVLDCYVAEKKKTVNNIFDSWFEKLYSSKR